MAVTSSVQALLAERTLLPDGSCLPCLLEIDPSGVILQVTPEPDAAARARATDTLDAQVLLTPSFVNAHTHLAMACFRGLDVESATGKNVVEDLFFQIETEMSRADMAAFARMGAYESLLHGVGLVWEHYYGGLELAQAIADTGLCAVIAPTLQDIHGPGIPSLEDQIAATLTLATDPSWAARGIWAALGPHATDTVSDTLWARIKALALHHELPIHVHVAQSLEEYQRSIETHDGISPVERLSRLGLLSDPKLRLLLVHMIFASKSDLGLLDPSRHTLGFCPSSQLIFDFPAHVASWQEQGLPWIVATDAAASNDSMNVQKELRHTAGLRTTAVSELEPHQRFMEAGGGNLDEARASQQRRDQLHTGRQIFGQERFLLERVWHIPGVLHPHVTAGKIEAGALANLAAWDLTHPHMWPPSNFERRLAMGDTTQAIFNLMSRGRWLGEPGNYHQSLLRSQAYQDAFDEAERRFGELLHRVGLR